MKQQVIKFQGKEYATLELAMIAYTNYLATTNKNLPVKIICKLN